MKKLSLLLIGTLTISSIYSQIYVGKNCEISFYSHSPIEDIKAVNKVTKPMLNASTGDVQMKIDVKEFIFPKPLMQEHFNEEYLETEKYPFAIFKGKINEKVDFTKNGDTKVTVTGKFTIHGVELEKTIDGLVSIDGNTILISTKFMLHVADYKIKVPSLYIANIAEDVEVKLNATLEPFKKN